MQSQPLTRGENCPTRQELVDFDAGQLLPLRMDQVASHLDDCPACSAVFESLEVRHDVLIDCLRERLPADILQDDSDLELLVSRAAALQPTEGNDDGKTVADRKSQRQARLAEWIPQLLTPPQASDELGRLGGYRVLRVLGMGGMGVVFQAEDPALKRLVALKVMSPSVASDVSRARFLREAQAMAAVHHDHVVKIYQVGEDRGAPFLAMELLEGQSLADRLNTEKRVSVREALQIAHGVALGLAAAHARGLMHRDIKPENIWLEGRLERQGRQATETTSSTPSQRAASFAGQGQSRVKILDFGLAHAADHEQNLTQSGTVVGTPNYLSPEQAEGHAVDARTDQFSLGIVLYEMLSGSKPFAKPTLLATLRSIGSDAPGELEASVPADVATLVKRLLEKRREDRFATTAEVIASIELCQERLRDVVTAGSGSRTSAEIATATASGSSRRKSRRVWTVVSAAALLVLLAGVIVTVRDKKGNIIARIMGDRVEIENQPEVPAVKAAPGQIDREIAQWLRTEKKDQLTHVFAQDADGKFVGDLRFLEQLPEQPFSIYHISADLTAQDVTRLAELPALKELGTGHHGDAALCEAISHLPVLEYVGIHGRGIGAEGIRHLRRLSSLRRIGFQEDQLDPLIPRLRGLRDVPQVEKLSLTGKVGLHQDVLREIAAMPFLKRIEVASATEFGPEVPPMPHLQELGVQAASLTDAAVGRLITACPNLRSVSFPNCRNLTDRSIEHLKALRHLEWVSLGNPEFTQVAVAAFKKAHPNVQVQTRFTPEQLAALPPMSPVALVQRPPKLAAKDGEAVESWTILPVSVQEGSAYALNMEGKLLATFGSDGAVRVWNVDQQKLIGGLIGHTAGPCSPAMKPTDRSNWVYIQTNSRRYGPVAWRPRANAEAAWLATASRDGSVRVWDVTKGTTIWKVEGDSDLINMLAWSSDGTKLTVGYDDGRVSTWSAGDWKELQELQLADGPPFSLGWSPDSKLLAVHASSGVQARDGAVVVWEPVEGKSQRLDSTGIQISLQANHLHGISAMRWSPDGKQLALRANDGVAIYDTTDWKPTHRLRSGQEVDVEVQDFDWSPDGTSLLVSANGKLHLHELAGGQATPVPLQDERWALKVEWVPGSSRVALLNVAGPHSYVEMLDTRTNDIRLINGSTLVHEFSADGTRLLAGYHHFPTVVNLESDKDAFWLPPLRPRVPPSLARTFWAPNGTIAIYLRSFWGSAGEPIQTWNDPQEHLVLWSPDSKKVLSYHGANDEFALFSVPERRRLAPLELQGLAKPQGQQLWALAFSPDAAELACGGLEHFKSELWILNGSSGKLTRRLKIADSSKESHSTWAVGWSRRGDRIAAVRDTFKESDPQRFSLLVVDAQDGKMLWPQPRRLGNGQSKDSLIWSPADRWLLCVTPEGIEAFDGADGRPQATYAIAANARAIHFLDQDTALCGSRDGILHRLNIAAGQHEIVSQGLGNIVEISPDGQQLAVDRAHRSIHSVEGQLQSSLLLLGNSEPFVVSADGHIWCPDQTEGPFWATRGSIPQTLVYIVQTASGQQTLTPIEFANRYGWRNEPGKVRLK